MICLRRTAIRVLSSSPSTAFSVKSYRTITHLTDCSKSSYRLQSSSFPSLQKRWASEEAATQSEPEADGATEALHGDNSIAASANTDADANAPEPAEQREESAAASAVEDASHKASETTSSATEQVKEAAQSAKESVVGAAGNLSEAAGFSSPSRSSGSRDPNTPEPNPTVYIGNIYFDVRGEDLQREFSRVGEVVSAKILMDNRGLSKGFGYVEFKTTEQATEAINVFNQQNFEGRRISVQYSSSRRRSSDPSKNERPLHAPTKTLFIGNMAFDMSDRDLNNLFREIRNVIDVRVAIDRRTGQPRGFAHADFVDVKDAEKAMDVLRGKIVCGRALRVDFSVSTGRAAMARPAPDSEGQQGE